MKDKMRVISAKAARKVTRSEDTVKTLLANISDQIIKHAQGGSFMCIINFNAWNNPCKTMIGIHIDDEIKKEAIKVLKAAGYNCPDFNDKKDTYKITWENA